MWKLVNKSSYRRGTTNIVLNLTMNKPAKLTWRLKLTVYFQENADAIDKPSGGISTKLGMTVELYT